MFESRQRTIIFVFALVAFVMLLRLFYMQVIDDSYKEAAANISLQRIIEYPYRGIVYDRKGKICVYNVPVYDVMVLPKEVKKGMDTLRFCELFGITKEEFSETITAARTYSKVKPSPFIKQLSHTEFAKVQDQLIDFPGFFISPRTVRGYDHSSMGIVLGYIGEISAGRLEKYKKEGNNYYRSGDYLGISGLENYYEEQLRGKRGVKFMMVDVNGIQKGHYKEGIFDTAAVRGENLYSTVDLELQKFGEELMKNKKGSIICMEPKTGEILAMISSPTYDPNLLRGRDFSKNYMALQKDPLKPLFNRALMAPYPPGSIFKTLQALTAMQEGVIDSNMVWPCVQDVVHCHPHPGPCNLRQSIQWSCNPYYLQVFRRIINQHKSGNTFLDTRIGYDRWREYISSFGIGQKLGIDMPSEKKGILRTIAYYDRIYGEKHWKYSNVYSLSIGQGELGMSPLHMANMACILANRGFYYTPHFVKKIGEKGTTPAQFKVRHQTKVAAEHFESIITGMQWAVQGGTVWSQARMKSVTICGKTGTAQNPHGKDHSIFICFAPKDNPKIAVATVVENSGFGGFVAAPIATLMVEKYLNDTIQRKNLYDHMLSRDYIHKDTSSNGKTGEAGKNH